MKFIAAAVVFLLAFALCTFGSAAAKSGSNREPPAKAIKLYYLPPSPPCRAVMMLAKAIGLDLELVFTNLMEGAHLTPEFLKMNPQHTLPTIDDNGFILWESRAIMAYFVNAYAKDTLYPKNPRHRAVVDQLLNFDSGLLFPRYVKLYLPVIMGNSEMQAEDIDKAKESLGFLDKMIEGRVYVAGENLTIADFSIIVTITNYDILGFDMSEYQNVMQWYERTKLALEKYGQVDINEAGAKMLLDLMNSKKQ